MDPTLKSIRRDVEQSLKLEFKIHDDTLIKFRGGLRILGIYDLKKNILEEAHCLEFAMHLASTKMY